LPFTREQFLAVFVAYNEAVWPVQVLAYVLGLLMAVLIIRPSAQRNRVVAAGLAAMWLWTGVGYHGMNFSAQCQRAWRLALRAGFACLALTSGLLVAATAPAASGQSAVDRFLLDRLERDGIPGLSIAIIERGRVSLVRAYGEAANGRPMRVDTPLAAASLMKSITAACVMQLVDTGQVELDQPVQLYLPEFTLSDPGAAAAITVRHLLHHNSGLADSGYPEMRLPQPASVAARLTNLAAARTGGAPGTAFHYFNPNYDLLARIVEVQSAMPFQDYVERFIFTPLGMRSSAVRPTMQALRRAALVSGQPLAQGHVEAFGLAVAMDEGDGFLGGAGGLTTTAEDMAQWLAFQAGDGTVGDRRILSTKGLSRLHVPAYGQVYAMGWFSAAVGWRQALFHNGILSTFYAEMTLFPDTGDGFVILANVNGLLPVRLAFPAIREGLAALIARQPLPPSSLYSRPLGAGLFLAWLAVCLAALFDLWRRSRAVASFSRWRVALGVTLRLVPLLLLITVPWTVAHFSDRVFSVQALGLAMIDILAGWLVVALVEVAAAAAVLRRRSHE